MKLTIERSALLKALAHVQSVVERRNTIPILANVMLDAQKSHLLLTATDMDIAIVESVAAEIARPGTVTVPAHTLYDIVRKLPEGSQIGVEALGDKGQVALRAGRSSFALASLPAADFPQMTGGELPHEFELAAAEFKALIDKTRFAISTEETRYYLNGIYLHAADASGIRVLRAVATDGHRLARVSDRPICTGASVSSISLCNSSTVLRGRITPGIVSAPAGNGISTRASRCPSVATARNTRMPLASAACR